MVGTASAQVPAAMQRDFTTARNHIPMKWNPQGYWASAPGAFKSGGNASEVTSMFTQTEQARGRIPKGYSFSVNSQGQYVVSGGAASKSTPPPAAPVAVPVPTRAPTPAPAKPVVVKPAPQPAPKVVPPPVVAPAPKAQPVVKPQPAPKPEPKVQSAPPPPPAPPPVKKAAPVIETPPPAPKPDAAAMRAAVLDPIHAAPATAKPSASAATPAPSAPSANGIPGDMTKSFLSRHKPVFMLYDKDSGSWKSSEGALKDLSTADEWCKQATAIDRRWKRIPENFSYKHVGAGQVQVTKD